MRFFAACLLLCLLAPVISAQPDEAAKQKWESYLSGLYLDPALKQADYDAHAANLLKSIEKEPASYGALIALRRYMELERELSDLRPMYKLLAGYARDDFMGCNAHPCEFADAYVKLAKRYNTSLEWQNVAKRWAGVTQAAFLGPFGDGTASLHDDVFSPEVMLDFNADCEGAYGRVKWQAMKHFNPLDATLSLYSQTRWSGYGYYVATEFASDEDRDCKLMIRVGGPAKVWLNGEPICNADARRATIPKELEFDVRLPRGRSVLLLKVSANADFRVRLFDARGYPVTGVVAMVPGPDTPRMKMKTGKAPNYPETTDLHLAIAYPEVGRKANSPTIEGLAYLVAAEIFEHNELSNRASEAAEHALEALPDEPLVQLAFLDWIEKGSLYSSSERRKLTRSMTDALLEQDPAFVPAIFKKAELLAADERYREAVDLLHGALEHTPAKWRVYLKLAEVFRDAGWRPEREAAIKSALREAPESLPVLQAASDYYSSIGAQDREIAADRKRLALMPGDPGAHLSLANTLARTGEVEESLRHMRALTAADPSSDFLRGRLAEALSANGKLSEALEVYEELAAQTPRPEEPLYQAARACLQLGREEQGVKYLERVLEADPGHHLARRELQRIRGESEDFWSGYTVGWDEAMQHDITREQFPRADSAMILDEVVQFMYEDGSSVSYVHQIRKVLTQEGVDLRGKDVVSGELITARTIQADGTVLEPITQPGGRVEFPGVKIGAYLDVAYLVRADGGPLRTLDGDAYYFQDQNLNEPFAISRWVLITPKDRQLNVVYHNLSPSDEGVTISATPKDERVVHTWDVRNPRMPETERFMPSPLEFIPWIECVHPRDWRDRARKLAEEGLRD
ncbi:MAG: tetratricopeptide repeat protein, partial [Planctomycetes bacterium]|nr:tetratricopeptide repeat protein [Planctomycetota bacterium]